MQGYREAVFADSPILWWPCDEQPGFRGGGARAHDLTVNALHGYHRGTLQAGSLPRPFGGGRSPDLNRTQHYFSRDTDTGESIALLPFGSAARTLECWVYPRDASLGGGWIAYGGAQAFSFQCHTVAGVTYVFTDGANSANNLSIAGNQIPALNTWSHVAFTHSGSNWAYYLDGQQMKWGTWGVAINTVNNSNLRVGVRSDFAWDHANSMPWMGGIAHAAIYPSALSADRILAHYNAGIRERRSY